MKLEYLRDVEDAFDELCFFHCEEHVKKDKLILEMLEKIKRKGYKVKIRHIKCEHSIKPPFIECEDSITVYYEELKPFADGLDRRRIAPSLVVKKDNRIKIVHWYDEIIDFLKNLDS